MPHISDELSDFMVCMQGPPSDVRHKPRGHFHQSEKHIIVALEIEDFTIVYTRQAFVDVLTEYLKCSRCKLTKESPSGRQFCEHLSNVSHEAILHSVT